MADPNDQLKQELESLKDAIGNATDQIRDASKFGQTAIDKTAIGLRDLSRVTKTTIGGLKDTTGEFSSFNAAANSSANFVSRLAGQNTTVGYSIGLMAKTVNQIVQATFGYGDSVNKFYDGIGNLGATVNKTTVDAQNMVKDASYFIGKHERFGKEIEGLGTSLTALGATTGEGASRVAKVFNNVDKDKVQLDFLRIGIGPEELNKIQANYLKLSTATGLKLSKNDEEVREASLRYAVSLNKISGLTGESRDKAEEQMMANARDVKFSAKKRQLLASGNKVAADAFDEATAMTAQLGAGIQAGLRDFIASGTATTEEGRALMIKSGGRIKNWVKAVEEGRMTSAELTQNIAKAEQRFVKQNSDALQLSGDYAATMKTTGQSIVNADKLANMSLDEYKKQLANQAKTPDRLKKDQSDLLDGQRKQGQEINRAGEILSGPVTKALLSFVHTVKDVAAGAVKLGILLSPKGSEFQASMEDFLRIIGDDADTKKILDKADKDVQNASRNIYISEQFDKKISEIAQDKANTEKELQLMVEKQKRGEAVDMQKMAENRKKILAKSTELQNLESEKAKELKGKNEQQLRQDREAAVAKREAAQRSLFLKTGNQGPSVAEGTEGATNVYDGLNIKSEESIAGGPVDPKLLELARQIQSSFPGVRFTALNDAYHQKNRPTSKHTKGRALDFSLNPPPKDAKEAAMYKKKLQDMGFAYVADEYFADKGAYTTAGHFHAHIGYADGGIATGPKSGYKATLHGTEAIIPMLDGKTVSIELKNTGTTNDFSGITNAIKAKSMMASSAASQTTSSVSEDSAYTLLDKIESMIASIDQSNSTQDKLKMYMRN
jgi:hypothetical protein